MVIKKDITLHEIQFKSFEPGKEPAEEVDKTHKLTAFKNSHGVNRKGEEKIFRGAYMMLPQTWSLAWNKLTRFARRDAPSITNADLLDRDFALWSPDGAECQNINRKNKSIVTYSMVLVNHVEICQLGIRPSSGNWIISQSQVQAKENRRTLDKLLYERLN